jgi:hypothetical protein
MTVLNSKIWASLLVALFLVGCATDTTTRTTTETRSTETYSEEPYQYRGNYTF